MPVSGRDLRGELLDWAYQAVRGWDGWSVEHGPDRYDQSLSPTPYRRERLLRLWYEKNLPKEGSIPLRDAGSPSIHFDRVHHRDPSVRTHLA
jgi:hypothetical protein